MSLIHLYRNLSIPDSEIQFSASRASGKGGQHVNTTSSAVQLRFNIPGSSLPEQVKSRLLAMSDSRLTTEGVLIIRSENERSQRRNRQDALERLREYFRQALKPVKTRRPTRPGKAAKHRRLDSKKHRGRLKEGRKPPPTPG
ncbi:alternative ribosome rescue aminoacyl-tRNA hydrolase ArfB [Salinispira pacifica]|uniref:Prokaryotic-type class I peptide chain release factors domain-containing protein n=1 Tax=Salinispira pacifica TaxID=1307761 RepID=V5WJ16_9SPIO|nr:alternative ribosome rescue aminoacyl-tRNA hydrolase ArfB [Salinispira pacifica]AHC15524.1 Hypothetical protein YaeJ with similarity to translation release factor [Salinispira pacifica]